MTSVPSPSDRKIFAVASFLAAGNESDRLISDLLIRLLPIGLTRGVRTLSGEDWQEFFVTESEHSDREFNVVMPNDHLLFDLPDLTDNALEYCWTKRIMKK